MRRRRRGVRGRNVVGLEIIAEYLVLYMLAMSCRLCPVAFHQRSLVIKTFPWYHHQCECENEQKRLSSKLPYLRELFAPKPCGLRSFYTDGRVEQGV